MFSFDPKSRAIFSKFKPTDFLDKEVMSLTDDTFIRKTLEHQGIDVDAILCINFTLEVRAVFLDISKAFDKVWHDGLIFKMRQNSISVKLLKLFQNYLRNRKQRVVLNGFSSDYSSIESGVPQGSVLGPLLFLIYINDLEKNIKSNVKFFADDTMLFSVVNIPAISANELNHDLKVISQWAYQ